MENNVVKVMLYDKEIGMLYWDVKSKRAVFNYNDTFVKENIDFAPLTAPISIYKNRPVLGNKEKLFQGLPPFLADSLPDYWGNKVFEAWAAQNHIPKRQLTPVDKLSFIGKRGMGAFEFLPATPGLDSSQSLQIDSLYNLALQIFTERQEFTVQENEELNLQSIYEVGTSAGGKHPKAIIAINNKTHEIRSGQVIHPGDFTYYILKFSESDDFPYTQMEMAYYEMALKAGIHIMPSKLIDIDGKYHFLTERFDRQKGQKTHTQTLAAMNPDASSYEELFEVSRRLRISSTEQSELYRRMVFNILSGNVDDHTKNFSFMWIDNEWHITPAYDITFTVNLDGASYENVHSITLKGMDCDFSEEDLLDFAKLNGIKNPKRIINEVSMAVSHFYDFASKYNIDIYWKDKIEEYLSGLVTKDVATSMNHYLPTVIEPYTSAEGFTVSNITIVENGQHDFRLDAIINGKRYGIRANHRSELATEIRNKGRNKMSVVYMKDLVQRHLFPLINP